MLDNPNILFAVIFASFFGAVIMLGIIGALVARLVTNFFGKNVPSDAAMKVFETAQAAGNAKPGKALVITPQAEPFVIAGVGFIVVFILTSMFITPTSIKSETAAPPAAKAAVSLPVSGDFTKIVSELPKGDPDGGKKLFTSQGCIGCHSQEKDKRLVGPSFYGLWGRAATRKPNMGVKEYIYESIVAPNAFVVEGYQSGLMTPTFAKTLSSQDMADLLAWLERDHNEK